MTARSSESPIDLSNRDATTPPFVCESRILVREAEQALRANDWAKADAESRIACQSAARAARVLFDAKRYGANVVYTETARDFTNSIGVALLHEALGHLPERTDDTGRWRFFCKCIPRACHVRSLSHVLGKNARCDPALHELCVHVLLCAMLGNVSRSRVWAPSEVRDMLLGEVNRAMILRVTDRLLTKNVEDLFLMFAMREHMIHAIDAHAALSAVAHRHIHEWTSYEAYISGSMDEAREALHKELRVHVDAPIGRREKLIVACIRQSSKILRSSSRHIVRLPLPRDMHVSEMFSPTCVAMVDASNRRHRSSTTSSSAGTGSVYRSSCFTNASLIGLPKFLSETIVGRILNSDVSMYGSFVRDMHARNVCVLWHCASCDQVKNHTAVKSHGLDRVTLDPTIGERFCGGKRHSDCAIVPLRGYNLINFESRKAFACVLDGSVYMNSPCCGNIVVVDGNDLARMTTGSHAPCHRCREVASPRVASSEERDTNRVICAHCGEVRGTKNGYTGVYVREIAEGSVRRLYFCKKHRRWWMNTATHSSSEALCMTEEELRSQINSTSKIVARDNYKPNK